KSQETVGVLDALLRQKVVGALVNGFSQEGEGTTPLYYDLPQYRSFWAEVEKLNAPFYLHPRNPLPQDSRIYAGHSWLMGPK
ncbi:hypothetical protein ACC848_43375, partial [Rhizobium johnstonii]